MGEREVEALVTHLAVHRRVAESTQDQAWGAILLPYGHVLSKVRGSLAAVRANRPKRLPTMLSKEEVRRLISATPEQGTHRLIVERRSGTGMRISECCQLCVFDPDFDRPRIVIRGGKCKGNKHGVTMLRQSFEARLKAQVEFVRSRHEHDIENGAGDAPVLTILEQKRRGAAREGDVRRSDPSSATAATQHVDRRRACLGHHSLLSSVITSAVPRLIKSPVVSGLQLNSSSIVLLFERSWHQAKHGVEMRDVQRLHLDAA